MAGDYDHSTQKMCIDYAAVNEIVLGVLGLISLGLFEFDHTDGTSILSYTLLICAIFTTLKGALLFYGIKKANKLCVLVYMILMVLVLLVAKGIVIYLAVSYVEDMTGDSHPVYLIRNFVTIYVVLFPVTFAFLWYVQFCLYKFYKSL